MRRSGWAVLAMVVLVACSGGHNVPTAETFEVEASAMAGGSFAAHLSGRQEVPPAATRAQGQANFWLNAEGTELRYRVNVANIENVLMAHIHRAPAGMNGPVVAWLYPSGPPPQLIPGRSQGLLAEGVLTSADLRGPLLGLSLDDLVEELRSGGAYVNVHTAQFPGGEVRGQIR